MFIKTFPFWGGGNFKLLDVDPRFGWSHIQAYHCQPDLHLDHSKFLPGVDICELLENALKFGWIAEDNKRIYRVVMDYEQPVGTISITNCSTNCFAVILYKRNSQISTIFPVTQF